MLSSLKSPLVIIVFCFILLGSQYIALTNIASYENYEESISLEIRPYNGQVLLGFSFTNVSGPPLDISDFINEPSFISITVLGTYSPDDNRTVVIVALNTTTVNVSQGKLKADIMKVKFENFFDVILPYTGNSTTGSTVTYIYRIDESPSIQRFRDAFLASKPSQGFGKMITSTLIGNYVSIFFNLKREGDSLVWWVVATVNYPHYFEKNIGQEYTIGLKGLTGYSGIIQSSPESSKSTLNIGISQVDADYKLISLETTPSQMTTSQGTYLGITSFDFEKTITGSVDDLSLFFRIVSSNYIDPTIIVAFGIVAVTILGIIGYVIWKKTKV
jgi:hypothetical protein